MNVVKTGNWILTSHIGCQPPGCGKRYDKLGPEPLRQWAGDADEPVDSNGTFLVLICVNHNFAS